MANQEEMLVINGLQIYCYDWLFIIAPILGQENCFQQ